MGAPYQIDIFKGPSGEPEAGAFALKLRRGTIHPGVMASFLTEACKKADVQIDELTDGCAAYKKMATWHIWKINEAQAKALLEYLKTFTDLATLKAHFAELRTKFPKTVYHTPSYFSHGQDDDDDEEDDDDDDMLPSVKDDESESALPVSLVESDE